MTKIIETEKEKYIIGDEDIDIDFSSIYDEEKPLSVEEKINTNSTTILDMYAHLSFDINEHIMDLIGKPIKIKLHENYFHINLEVVTSKLLELTNVFYIYPIKIKNINILHKNQQNINSLSNFILKKIDILEFNVEVSKCNLIFINKRTN